MNRRKMCNIAKMETNVTTTSSTGVATTMLPLLRNCQDTSQDNLLTVSGGLSVTGALDTSDQVFSSVRDPGISGRDPVSSSRDVVISAVRDVETSSGRERVSSSGRDKNKDVETNSGRDQAISSCRDVISSGRVSQVRS